MQKHRPIYRITALLLAFLVLFSSTGIAIDMHYCQGSFKSLSVLGKAKSCHEIAQQQASCPHHQQQAVQKACSMAAEKNCCDSEMYYFQSDQNQQIASVDILLSKTHHRFSLPCYFLLFADRYRSADPDNYRERGPVPEYRSPHIPRDISVLFETFLL